MVKIQKELERKNYCICMDLPCVHNPELSEDIADEIRLPAYTTPKGVKYVFLNKKDFQVIEESTNGIMKVRFN
jgi:hypothetical protein